MDQEKYEAFMRMTKQGRRKEAAAAVQEFAASFRDLEEKRRWTESYLEGDPDLDKIRHELYEQVIFPVLLEGWRRDDPWSLWWLARTGRNFQRSQDLWLKLEHQTPGSLLKKLHAMQPDDDEVRLALLENHLDWLGFAGHEWPGAILYGMDAANLEQCGWIGEILAEARALDREGRHTEYLDQFGVWLTEYQARLRAE